MTPTLIDPSVPAPHLNRAQGLALVPAGPSLWRVADDRGHVIGHLHHTAAAGERPYRARRFRPASGGFVEIGAFWSADDAVDALRLSR